MVKASIVGTGSTTPKRILTNKELETIVDTTDEWISRRTGIRERRISSTNLEENTADMAILASKKALEMAGIPADTIELIVVGTVTPDRQFPSCACIVQKGLGAGNAVAFDVSAGCSGFIYALSIAENAIHAGQYKNALIIGTERLSSVADWTDRSTCVLLGDGAGAVVLIPTEKNEGILSTHLGSDGNYWDLLYASDRTGVIPPEFPQILDTVEGRPFYLKMEGNRLFKKAVSCLSDVALAALKSVGLSCDDIRLMVPHQANLRIIRAAAEKLSIPMEKVYINVDRYGNTSSASIPIALDEAYREGMLRKGDHILLVTFGAGLTWGASVVRWAI